jgi:glutathione synthase/RimK-type ligase-like ATP-grasp enzyme
VLANRDRLLVSTVRRLAAERGVEVASFAGDWILRLTRGAWTEHVVGYVFPLNSAGARAVSADKAATAELLAARGVPCVAHHLVLRPDLAPYVGSGGNWRRLLDLGERHGWDLVVKPNEGTGGEGVVRVRSARELEAAIHDGFARHRALALSPFHEIETEYRAVLLDDEGLLTYAKRRPVVVGDGARSVGVLAEAAGLDASLLALDLRGRVPDEGRRVLLDWRHNLQLGSVPRPIDDAATRAEVERLAAAAAGTLGLRFASVDVVETADGLAVLEANAGVMLEAYARAVPGGPATAQQIYGAALDALLAGR